MNSYFGNSQKFSLFLLIRTCSCMNQQENLPQPTPGGTPLVLKPKVKNGQNPAPTSPWGHPPRGSKLKKKILIPTLTLPLPLPFAITISHSSGTDPPPQLGWVTVGPWASRSGGWPAARRQTPAPPRPPAAGAAGPPASPAAAAAGTGEPRRRCGPPGRPVRQCPAWSHTHRPPPLGNCSSSRSMGQQLLT